MTGNMKIKRPVEKGHVKVPVIMQLEMLECGAASLAMILAYYDKWVPLEQVRLDCGVSRDGSNAGNIVKAARSYGMIAKAWSLEPEDLLKEGPFPCILHWGFNHFVVLDGFKGRKAIINDPARGRVEVSWDEFDREFTGVCLTFEPGEDFQPSGRKQTAIDFAKQRLDGTSAAVAFVVLTTVITSVMGIIYPVFSRIFMDRLLTGTNPEWFYPFLAAISGITIIDIIAVWCSVFYSLRIQAKMAAVGSSTYMWHVLHLPMQFFSQRIPADIAGRQEKNASIANSIVSLFGPLFINTIMMLIYLIIMIRYSLVLTVIGVSSIFINMAVSSIVTAKRINIMRVQLRDQSKLDGATVSGISMIETIKASGAEKGYFGKWAGLQASVNSAQIRFARINQYIGMIPSAVSAIADLAVLGVGVYLVLKGQFTIGMVMAFQGFLSSFMTPANSLITAGRSFQEMITDMERIDDVMSYPEDKCFQQESDTEEYKKLTGRIELKNVTFGYSKLAQPLIENFSMTVEAGKKVAFVGRSGCGKSTLASLISGLYEPWEGEILFDGKPIKSIDRDVFTGSISVVNQDITLFEDSISNNIKMWDTSIEGFEVIMAAHDAGIHDDIIQKKDGYQHVLQEGGKDLSGGQRQRIEIARALAQDPTICIMDEATSALDAKTEFEVVNSISDRGITCIVIAHRLSTIRDCDEIIVLDNGKVVERGRHEELYARDGVYRQLVINE